MPKVSTIERTGIILSIIGLILMFQPFRAELFPYGFYMMTLGAVIYILSTYLPVRNPQGETTVRDVVKWSIIIGGVVVSVAVISMFIAPYTVA